jgi:hypothetical protein
LDGMHDTGFGRIKLFPSNRSPHDYSPGHHKPLCRKLARAELRLRLAPMWTSIRSQYGGSTVGSQFMVGGTSVMGNWKGGWHLFCLMGNWKGGWHLFCL